MAVFPPPRSSGGGASEANWLELIFQTVKIVNTAIAIFTFAKRAWDTRNYNKTSGPIVPTTQPPTAE